MTAPTPTGAPASASDAVVILYTNYRGETAVRRIVPRKRHPMVGPNDVMWFGTNDYHKGADGKPEPQWFITAEDVDRKPSVMRDFAWSGVKAWGQEAVDAALAPPAVVPESVRRAFTDAEQHAQRYRDGIAEGDLSDSDLRKLRYEAAWAVERRIDAVDRFVRTLLSTPSARAAPISATHEIDAITRKRFDRMSEAWNAGGKLDEGDLSFLFRMAGLYLYPPSARADTHTVSGGVVPEGWRLVPPNPTEEMLEAFCDEHEVQWNAVRANGYKPGPGDAAQPCYRAMLAAAPAAPEPAAGGDGWRWTARDGAPIYDAEFGERWLLTWSKASATYGLSCIDGQWGHGETIELHGEDAWMWLAFSPGDPPTPADAGTSKQEPKP